MRAEPNHSHAKIHAYIYIYIYFWLKTFNRLRHRDKLTTVRLGWLGSATYARLLVKKDYYNR